MSTNRVKQIFLGSELTDAELEDIPSPRMELHAHVMTKFVQMSSILGASIIGPLVGLKRGRSIAAAFRAAPLGGRIGLVFGMPASVAMTEMMIRGNEPERVYDRCFRLRHNMCQNRVDRNSVYSGLAGAAVTGIAGCPLGLGPATGFFLGVAGGCIGTGIYNALDEKNKS